MKLLILLPRVPFPLEKGDKLRAFYQIKELSKYHDIYLVALSNDHVTPDILRQLTPFCRQIHIIPINCVTIGIGVIHAFFTGLPLQCGYFYSRNAARKIKKLIHDIQPEHIYCQMIRVSEYVKNIHISKTLDYQDVLSKGMQRRYQKAPWGLKPFFALESKRLLKYEKRVFEWFDNKTIITGVDRDLIPHEMNDQIHVVANGVDFTKYQYHQENKIYDLIFAGNMAYPPNIQAAIYLAKYILPELHKTMPEINLAIVGASPHHAVQALSSSKIVVTGWVDSMADYYAQAKIFIAPMQMGTGLQNKLIEAMAMKLPCITSTLAGKPLEGIVNNQDLMICETLTGYVDAVKLLLTNSEIYHKISQNGYQFVKQNYNWENVCDLLNQIITQKKQ